MIMRVLIDQISSKISCLFLVMLQ